MGQWQCLPKYETLDLIPRIKKKEEAGRKRRRKKRRKRERRKRKHFFLSYFLPALFMWDSNPHCRREAGHRNKTSTETEESAEQASLNCPLSLTKRNFSYALG